MSLPNNNSFQIRKEKLEISYLILIPDQKKTRDNLNKELPNSFSFQIYRNT
jgi:hypothetical protein